MIGVVCKDSEKRVAEELFELFKTPWEFYRQDRYYDVVICTLEEAPKARCEQLIIYSDSTTDVDSQNNIHVMPREGSKCISYKDQHIPIYEGLSIIKAMHGKPLIRVGDGKAQVICIEMQIHSVKTVRVGYNLFAEVRFLLTSGQPIQYAQIPTLEVHIAILRDILIEHGRVLVEIPPIPWGYDLIGCITHDVDDISIKSHKMDRSVLGFLYRSLILSPILFAKRKRSFGRVLQTWTSVLSVPLIWLGLRKDFWWQFDKYLEVEKSFGVSSTYFFLPFKNEIGFAKDGSKRLRLRARAYDVLELAGILKELEDNDFEVGVHGINSWHDVQSAQKESSKIHNLINNGNLGVRIHWLYLDQDSFAVLDQARYAYDTTVGYNETVGFKAGTAQVYKPLNSENLLELPLSIQDSSLFLRMPLSNEDALRLCDHLIGNVKQYGGVVTLLWHQRSLGPERLWGDAYERLLTTLKEGNCWVAKGRDVVKWFRGRRSIKLNPMKVHNNHLDLRVDGVDVGQLQAYRLRIYNASPQDGRTDSECVAGPHYVDVKLSDSMNLTKRLVQRSIRTYSESILDCEICSDIRQKARSFNPSSNHPARQICGTAEWTLGNS